MPLRRQQHKHQAHGHTAASELHGKAPPAGLEAQHALPAQQAGQHPGIEEGRQRGGQRQPGVGQWPDQDQVEHHIGDHRNDTDLDRRLGVLAGKEPRRQYLDQHEGDQAEGIGTQAHRRHHDIVVGHGAVVEQRDQQRLGQQRQRQRRWQPQQQHRSQRPVQHLAEVLGGRLGVAPRQRRQDHRTDGHAEHPQWQLHQAV